MDSNDVRFEFVAQRSNGTLSREDRSRVRRHAMKTIGASRRRTSDVAPAYTAIRSSTPSWSLSGLELLVKDSGLDPMDLSALASVHLGAVVSAVIQMEAGQLRHVLLCRQRSYFSFIPARFGHVVALDDAFRCLVTIVHSKLIPTHKRSDNIIFRYYGKALRSLQSAVDDPVNRYAAETLCAASILALFELFNSSNGVISWSNHMAGVSRLIQLRGPDQFTSEFEQALLIQLANPISAEAIIQNTDCFLDDPAWTEVLKNATDLRETFTDRSPLGIELLILLAKVPGLMKRNAHAVMMHVSHEDLDALVTDIRALRARSIAWRREFNTALMHALDVDMETHAENKNRNIDKRYELLGVSLVIHILVSRMLVCVASEGRALLEDEVQDRALELKQLHQSVQEGNHSYRHNRSHHRADFFLTQKTKIADAAIATHADFRIAAGSNSIAESWMLEKFKMSLGRVY
ncbi:hypothetical protein HD806DRAFT_497400 [Xylariaceae sp. AK1471]|nr:hypothetical protein HD806DRAFT_497400 [Xylariaceae sp. AK1471]